MSGIGIVCFSVVIVFSVLLAKHCGAVFLSTNSFLVVHYPGRAFAWPRLGRFCNYYL